MKTMELKDVADYLESAQSIEQTIQAGLALVHIGTNAAGARFVLLNDMHGKSVVTEAL